MPPSPSRPSPSRRRQGPRPGGSPHRADRPLARRPTPWSLLVGAVALFVVAAAIGAWVALQTWNRDRPSRLLAEARAATDADDKPRAMAAWHAWNETKDRSAATLLVEAQLAGDLNRGEDSERIARQATRLDPASTAAWTLRINRLRVLDQPVAALDLGLSALSGLRTVEARRAVLKATTLATLAEVPDAEARSQLDRWIAADPADADARVARLSRIAANPHPGDPDRAARIVELQGIIARQPEHVAAREALTVALADSGEVERGRAVLANWPEPARGAQFDRLQGRWDLEYDHQPARAAGRFHRALLATPHDWKSHYGLARALRILGRTDDAKAEALSVARLRERLDPALLGPRLTTDFARIDEGSAPEAAAAMADLAALCRSVGLIPLADAWTRAASPDPPSKPAAIAPAL